MRPQLRLLGSLLLGLLFIPALTGIAEAAFKLDYISTTPLGGGLSSYNYNIVFATTTGQESVISDDFVLNPGVSGTQDFITIYDILGYSGTSVGGNPFVFQTQLTGVNGPDTAPGDDSTLLNVTFRYTGLTPLTSGATFSGISITSTFSGTVRDYYTSQQTNLSEGGTKIGEVGRVLVPGPPENIGLVVPEPASMAIWCIGALGCAAAGYRRRRQVASSESIRMNGHVKM